MEITQLAWLPHNEAKLRAHGIARAEVDELAARRAYTVGLHPDYLDQVRITGPTVEGRFITIAMQDLGRGRYRPITGWLATAGEIRRYIQSVQGD